LRRQQIVPSPAERERDATFAFSECGWVREWVHIFR